MSRRDQKDRKSEGIWVGCEMRGEEEKREERAVIVFGGVVGQKRSAAQQGYNILVSCRIGCEI